ncbi:hypothetical protein ILUMI_10812 [Ignelater luminosus]|uniref:Fido domain-containing protein n=1 Tax=Ignelater luminosus TaxID=2038154 RepID=A0A8K0CX54_IGNLU|nr:hypothetical protein ILUMI_10812 [Ignelater luminosus]
MPEIKTFVEQPHWRPTYAAGIRELLTEIPQLFERVKTYVIDNEHEDFMKGFVDAYRNLYLTECNRGENTGTLTVAETELALRESNNSLEKNQSKTLNLSQAVSYLFGESLYVETLRHEFNIDLAKKLNEIIGDGLFDGGCYRKEYAQPARTNFIYLAPHLIENRMKELFEYMRAELKCPTKQWYDLAALFFVRFLYIHPFNNGNGRTARLLLSALLLKHSTVPVSLFSSSFDQAQLNRTYLQCLEEAHEHKNFSLLTSLIIESTHRTLHTCITCLDID